MQSADDNDSQFDALMQQPAAPEKHEKSSGAGDTIIGMLEVAESDFAKNLAEEQQEEDAAQTEYDKLTQENKVTKASKEQDVKYKTKEAKSLDEAVAEATSDKAGSQEELDAVLKYYDSLKEQCIEKVEPYEERKKRREAEIAGLKEALSILAGEAVLLQRETTKKLRGVRHHHQ
jgi:chromosome segregation ATPase